jgi:hypothetical protein
LAVVVLQVDQALLHVHLAVAVPISMEVVSVVVTAVVVPAPGERQWAQRQRSAGRNGKNDSSLLQHG